MYNRNNFKRNVLITTPEVLFHAPSKQTVDQRMIESSIIVAEERFIRVELGWDLYDAIVNEKNKILADAAAVTAAQAQLPNADPPLVVGDIVNALEYFTTAAYKDLWYQHLWKICAECVMTSAYPEGFVQFGSEGSFHNSPPAGLMVTSGQVVPLLSSMKWAVDKKVMERISPLVESMHTYICRNKSNYPLYKRDCPQCNDDTKKTKNIGIADIYDDELTDRCCGDGWWKEK